MFVSATPDDLCQILPCNISEGTQLLQELPWQRRGEAAVALSLTPVISGAHKPVWGAAEEKGNKKTPVAATSGNVS